MENGEELCTGPVRKNDEHKRSTVKDEKIISFSFTAKGMILLYLTKIITSPSLLSSYSFLLHHFLSPPIQFLSPCVQFITFRPSHFPFLRIIYKNIDLFWEFSFGVSSSTGEFIS